MPSKKPTLRSRIRVSARLSRALLSRLIALVLLAALASPAAADPLTLILLKLLRDQLITRSLEAAWDKHNAPAPAEGAVSLFTPAPASLFAPALADKLDDQQIRQLIDDGFVHLTPAQRDEVYASVQRILADPEHAGSRRVILEELAAKGLAVRQAHDQLSRLSSADRQKIANEARAEYSKLPQEDRDQLVKVLRAGTAPIPRELSDSLLTAFASVSVE